MACLLMEGMEQFDLNDEVIAACIIHDLRKQGVEKSGHTVKNHADLAAALVMEVAVANPGSIEDESFQLIYNGVGYHYGPWSHGEWACSRFYSDVDVFSRLVHVADYLASRKEIGSKISL